jgi:hypothetical protein
MRNLRLPTVLAGIVAVHGLATSPTADANALSLYMTVPGASCQLSIPTTDTGVRPKAVGFRNESTVTSNFVICPLTSPTDLGDNFAPFTLLAIWLRPLDGLAHSVSCTAVVGDGVGVAQPLMYSTQTIPVPAADAGAGIWRDYDFGQGGAYHIKGSAWSSITCSLPPQVEIRFLRAGYEFEIGS